MEAMSSPGHEIQSFSLLTKFHTSQRCGSVEKCDKFRILSLFSASHEPLVILYLVPHFSPTPRCPLRQTSHMRKVQIVDGSRCKKKKVSSLTDSAGLKLAGLWTAGVPDAILAAISWWRVVTWPRPVMCSKSTFSVTQAPWWPATPVTVNWS